MRIVAFFFLLFCTFSVSAQIEDPVKWSTSLKKLSATEYELIFVANIQDGWNTYSQYLESDDGPVRTSFHYDKGSFQLVGKNIEEGDRKEGHDKLFDMNVIKLLHTATFRQKVKVTDPSKPITGYVEYMCCNDEKCLPPTEFAFKFMLNDAGAEKKKVGSIEGDKAKDTQNKNAAPSLATEEVANADFRTPDESGTVTNGIKEPVKWQAAIKKLDADTYLLTMTANLDKNWSIYSQHTDENGPVPTSFTFTESSNYALGGETVEAGDIKEVKDPLFGGVVVKKYAKGPVVFTQKVKVTDPGKPISGYLSFMACDLNECLPPTDVNFYFVPAELSALIGVEADKAINGGNPGNVPGPPTITDLPKPQLDAPLGLCGDEVEKIDAKTGYFKIFFLGFLGGLLALLTPCVFPMIPFTVSFFTKMSQNKKGKLIWNASLYAIFITLVYLLLSIPFHLIDNLNPDILNDISTNVWLNIIFFAVFVFFAFSFFGYYEIALPSSWVNRSSQAESLGGMIGIFFAALTLALVSFSCTGPILGSLLAGTLSSDGGAWQLTAGMGGFGLGLALPFAVFAAFPSIMQALPKSGSWMNTIKVILGFLELALALKFLSNADLVKHWELLTIEPFLAIWLLIFLGLALYLFGLIHFPHYGKERSNGVKIGLGLVSFAFVVYLGSGFMVNQATNSYRPLTLLSGMAPPVCYSWFKSCDCPQDLTCFKDLEQGLAYARKVNKPVMLDFTGYACVNCRKMEEHVWPTKPVYPLLEKDYVLISLYVDDRQELPAEQQVEVKNALGGTRKLRTVGNKWSYFQTEYFQTNTQPYYVLLSPDGQLLTQPRGYTPEQETYAGFLQCGKDAFTRLSMK
ncbi:MAG: cytochrome c biogenesis protein CcdA [Haliscomenobacter sp.]|uniref:protein-disulfide reductase DsbD family protein n=1 Tax=Haliscomenobacter sp. TaxID=2717303 RepID=UPI0029BB6B1A|nr:cytochrome c biogenesis protein CcdA [Haliscomenobacter sp.]MDX2070659.1 cytochrome c biogenesis protein CcdA [Haliscomenobacter sp.]